MRIRLRSSRRLVIKVGSSSLTDDSGALDVRKLGKLVAQVAAVRERGVEVVMVSSGAIAAGLPELGLHRRPKDMASLQAAASVGQGRLMHSYANCFSRKGLAVGQVLLTQYDFVRRSSYLAARRTLNRLLALGAVPIVNENDTVAVEEIRYGDNDLLAALVANLVHADLLLILSDIEGLYEADPRSNPNARLLSCVEDVSALCGVSAGGPGSRVGSGGMASKLEATRIATFSKVGVVIAKATRPSVMEAVLDGEDVGTYFAPRPGRVDGRKLWIAFASPAKGSLVVDAGAAKALVEGGKSLLAAGVTAVRGEFGAGDTVEVRSASERLLAKGVVGFDSSVLPGLLGHSTGELGRERGPDFAREVIHRDNLVILDSHHRSGL
ncbi:MAG: glutamate 5-kinase [Actinomycetota bacterium]